MLRRNSPSVGSTGVRRHGHGCCRSCRPARRQSSCAGMAYARLAHHGGAVEGVEKEDVARSCQELPGCCTREAVGGRLGLRDRHGPRSAGTPPRGIGRRARPGTSDAAHRGKRSLDLLAPAASRAPPPSLRRLDTNCPHFALHWPRTLPPCPYHNTVSSLPLFCAAFSLPRLARRPVIARTSPILRRVFCISLVTSSPLLPDIWTWPQMQSMAIRRATL